MKTIRINKYSKIKFDTFKYMLYRNNDVMRKLLDYNKWLNLKSILIINPFRNTKRNVQLLKEAIKIGIRKEFKHDPYKN